MKKGLTLMATLCLTSLFAVNASAFEVIFTNQSDYPGSLTTSIGANCPNGKGNNTNTWESPTIYYGSVVTGQLPCPVTSSSWNYGDYIFKASNKNDSLSCEHKYADDVDTILKNGYTQVYVTVVDHCRIERTFK